MITYLLRRSLYGLLIIFLTSIVMYVIVVSNPAGGPLNEAWIEAQHVPGFNNLPADQRVAKLAEINHQLGLDEPPYILYLRWLYDWQPTEENNPALIRVQLKDLQDELSVNPSLLTAAQAQNLAQSRPQLEQQVSDLQKQIADADQKLANCRNLLDFSKLGACLAIPRKGGLLTGNWGAGQSGNEIGANIFGISAEPGMNDNGDMVNMPDTHLYSPFANTMFLIFFAIALALIFAFPIGILSAVKQYSRADYFFSILTFAGMALPIFWLGAVMLLLNFKLEQLGWPSLPISGIVDNPNDPAQYGDVGMRLKHLLVPGAVLAFTYMAGYSRFLRSSMLEVLGLDYVRTAWAKGLRPRAVILKHALRNALIPLVTRVALTVPLMLGSAVLVEHIFNYDGMGQMIYTSAVGNDWNTMMALLVVSAVIVILSSIVADYAYALIDPRIRYS